VILGFDPGRDKCGIALMSRDLQLYNHQVVESTQAIAAIASLQQQYAITQIVMGNQTTSKQWQKQLKTDLGDRIPITLVDERYSTLEARDRYWQMYPPRGLKRLIPQGMRLPPRPIDDIVAILLIERYFAQH